MRGPRSLHAAARVRLPSAPARRPSPAPGLAAVSAVPSRPLCRRCFSASARQKSPKPSPPPPSTADTPPEVPPAGAVIFSGIQPTGVPHLGNYLGAIQRWVQLQDTAAADGSTSLYYSVVDLHALTTVSASGATGTPGDVLRQRRREMLAAFLAVGLDPDRSVLFYQSAVPAHAELMWLLSCTASVGYLSRMTQWKSKLHLQEDTAAPLGSDAQDKGSQKLKLGLFSYPVLQAADVLVHRATHVPVGEDQCQHLEFARECATNFNHTHGGGAKDGNKLLVSPTTLLSPARRVMSLQQPTLKMSKSHADPRSRILLTDDAETITAKIMRAKTDSVNAVTYDTGRPGVTNLLEILALVEGDVPPGGLSSAAVAQRAAAAAAELQGKPLKDLKTRVAAGVVQQLAGMRERFVDALERDGGAYLDRVAEHGAKKARANAEATMEAVREAVGL